LSRLRPERLLQQADALLRNEALLPCPSGQPDQTDLRRAIAAGYYAVFHFILTAAADMVVGAPNRSAARYSLVYRSVDHRHLKERCSQLKGSEIHKDFRRFAPVGGFGKVADCARLVGNLYELRNSADYDPSKHFTIDEARTAVSEAELAIRHFEAATTEQQETFLTLLLFKSKPDR
jgi:uncharacterized protein (UPF0332 family)